VIEVCDDVGAEGLEGLGGAGNSIVAEESGAGVQEEEEGVGIVGLSEGRGVVDGLRSMLAVGEPSGVSGSTYERVRGHTQVWTKGAETLSLVSVTSTRSRRSHTLARTCVNTPSVLALPALFSLFLS